jgi:group I intron endonuclease
MTVAAYTITNKTNGKQYVGISTKLDRRWLDHKKADGWCVALHNSIKKHGVDNFEFAHIADAYSWEDACFLETALIKQLNTKSPNGYNLTFGGDGTVGFKHTKEECRRRSEICPTRNPDIAKLVADKLRGRKRPKLSGKNNAMFGRLGEKSHALKHIIVAKNMENGNTITLAGAKEIADAGFNRAHVYACARNIRKTHKNHTFKFKGEAE